MSSSLDPLIAFMDGAGHDDQDWAPRVLYIDVDDDLPDLLDRVEEAGSPAIVVLPEGARAVRGTVAARLLQRRADAAGIPLVLVTTDRAAIAQLRAIGVPTASTVGEARRALPGDDQHAGVTHPPGDADATARAPTVLRVPMLPSRPAPAPDPVDDEIDGDEHAARASLRNVVADARRLPGSAGETPALPGTTFSRRGHKAEEESAAPLASAPADAGAPLPVAQIRVVQTTRTNAPPRGRWRRTLWAAGALLLAALLGVALWAFLFPRATIVISYAATPYSRDYRIVAGGSAIRVHSTHLDVSDTLLAPATGIAQVPDGRATGTVTFANPLDGYVRVPAGTVVTTGGGVAFATIAAVAVPGAVHSFSGSTNGQQSAQVEAVQAGPGSNVPANTITRIQGRLTGVLLVTNYNPTGGGTMRLVYSITQHDVAGATATLRGRLTAQAEATLRARFAHSPARRITGIHPGAPHVVPVTRNGKLYASVTLGERVTMDYLHAQDVQRLSAARAAINLSSQNLALVPGSEHVETHVAIAGAQFIVTIHVQAQVVPAIDTTNLRGLLTGRSVADARQLLDGSARYGRWRYTLTTDPDWTGRMPQMPSLIHISIQRRLIDHQHG